MSSGDIPQVQEDSLSGYKCAYKWKRRLPASKFGAIIKSKGKQSSEVAHEILYKKCKFIFKRNYRIFSLFLL